MTKSEYFQVKKITIQYYAILREQRGIDEEQIETAAQTACELYAELKEKYCFPLEQNSLKVAVNDEFSEWKTALNSGDAVVFIPPVSGG